MTKPRNDSRAHRLPPLIEEALHQTAQTDWLLPNTVTSQWKTHQHWIQRHHHWILLHIGQTRSNGCTRIFSVQDQVSRPFDSKFAELVDSSKVIAPLIGSKHCRDHTVHNSIVEYIVFAAFANIWAGLKSKPLISSIIHLVYPHRFCQYITKEPSFPDVSAFTQVAVTRLQTGAWILTSFNFGSQHVVHPL